MSSRIALMVPAAMATLLVAACGAAPQPAAAAPVVSISAPRAATPSSRTQPARPSNPSMVNVPAGSTLPTPAQVAIDWLAASRFAAWDQPPTAWIDKVAPLVTGQVNTENQRLRSGSIGAGWAVFVENRCTATVVDAGAVIPPEAPATSKTVHVQVAGTVRTECETGPAVPDEAAAATLTVAQTPVGWKVAGREQ